MRITEKNLRALRYVFGERTRVPNGHAHPDTGAAYGPSTRRSIRRCVEAGLVRIEGDDLVLVEKKS